MKFWSIKAKADNTGELVLYGEISETSWWGDEITPKTFTQELDALGDITTLNIYINSPGGDVFAGMAIHNIIKRKPYKKVAYIDGLAASIASVICLAADEVIAYTNSAFMIHNAWTCVCGNKNDLRKCADDMEKIDQLLLNVYTQKSKQEEAEIQAKMDTETWFTAQEAKDYGFVDTIMDGQYIAASIADKNFTINGQTYSFDRFKTKPPICAHEINPQENGEQIADNGGERQPVADISNTHDFTNIKQKLLEVF